MARKVPNFRNRESRVEITGLTHGLTNFTLEAWVAGPTRTRTTTVGIVTYRASARANAEWYGLFLQTIRGRPGQARLRFVLGNGPVTTVDVETANETFSAWANTWRHVAVSYDGTNAIVYLDGKPAATTTATGGGSLLPRDRELSFGSYNQGTRRVTFRGRISEVRLWNAVRSGPEIDAGRFCPLSENDSLDCLGYWPMDEELGNIINDRTTTKNNGTAYDIPGWVDWNDNTNGTFMDDVENAIEVKEDQKVIASGSTSDWGKNVAIDTQRKLNIRNTCTHCDVGIVKVGTNPLDFKIVNGLSGPVTLKPQGGSPNSQDVDIAFSPRREGVRTSRVSVETNRPYYNPYRFDYDVKAEYVKAPDPKPAMTVAIDGNPINNGYKENWGTVNNATSKVLTITNNGAEMLNISRIDLVPAIPFTLGPRFARGTRIGFTPGSNSKTITLAFDAGAVTTLQSATITIFSDDPKTPSFSFTVSAQAKAQGSIQVKFSGRDMTHGGTVPWPRNRPDSGDVIEVLNPSSRPFTLKYITVSPAPFELVDPYNTSRDLLVEAKQRSGAIYRYQFTIMYRGASGSRCTGTVQVFSDDPVTPVVTFQIQAG